MPPTSSPVTVEADSVWLIHPGRPELSRPVEFRVGSFEEDSRPATVGVFEVLGRADAVIITDGQRKSGASKFTLSADTPTEAADLLALLDGAQALQVNAPPSLGLDLGAYYIQPLDVTVRRRTDIGTDPYRDIEVTYRRVSMPIGGALPQGTYADVLANFASYADLAAVPYSSLL